MPKEKDKGKNKFPGEASGRFTLHTIEAGATCTMPIRVPFGMDAVAHGGPTKEGFLDPDEVEVVSAGEDYIQFCLHGGEPLDADAKVRVSFVDMDDDDAGEDEDNG